MEASDIFNIIHNAVESQEFGKRISHAKMAERLCVPMRTYQDWRIGNSNPLAVHKAFELLMMLEDDEIEQVIKKFRKLQKKESTK